jgi:hypothetical protein
MLAQEEQRYAAANGSPKEKLPDLSEFMLDKLRTGHRTKDSLRLAAEEAGYEIDGRSIHATLVNLIKRNEAVEVSEGQYAART